MHTDLQKTALIVGDSYTAGDGLLDCNHSYAFQLQALRPDFNFQVYAYPGQTISSILNNFQKIRLLSYDVCILQVGTNNCRFMGEDKNINEQNKINIEKSLRELTVLVHFCQSFSEKILYLLPPLLDETSHYAPQFNPSLILFRNLCNKIETNDKFKVVDMDSFSMEKPNMFVDGLHFSKEAHFNMAKFISDLLGKL